MKIRAKAIGRVPAQPQVLARLEPRARGLLRDRDWKLNEWQRCIVQAVVVGRHGVGVGLAGQGSSVAIAMALLGREGRWFTGDPQGAHRALKALGAEGAVGVFGLDSAETPRMGDVCEGAYHPEAVCFLGPGVGGASEEATTSGEYRSEAWRQSPLLFEPAWDSLRVHIYGPFRDQVSSQPEAWRGALQDALERGARRGKVWLVPASVRARELLRPDGSFGPLERRDEALYFSQPADPSQDQCEVVVVEPVSAARVLAWTGKGGCPSKGPARLSLLVPDVLGLQRACAIAQLIERGGWWPCQESHELELEQELCDRLESLRQKERETLLSRALFAVMEYRLNRGNAKALVELFLAPGSLYRFTRGWLYYHGVSVELTGWTALGQGAYWTSDRRAFENARLSASCVDLRASEQDRLCAALLEGRLDRWDSFT